jgi:hypothetical protein
MRPIIKLLSLANQTVLHFGPVLRAADNLYIGNFTSINHDGGRKMIMLMY